MRVPPKVAVTLVTILIGLCVARYFAGERFGTVLFATAMLVGIVDAVWEQRAYLGLRGVGITIRRSESPVFYGFALFLYLGFFVGSICTLFIPRTK